MTPEQFSPPPADCALGRPLGDCELRRSGCDSLYDVLIALYPTQAMLEQLRQSQSLDPDVARWVQRLEGIGGDGYEPNRRKNPNRWRG